MPKTSQCEQLTDTVPLRHRHYFYLGETVVLTNSYITGKTEEQVYVKSNCTRQARVRRNRMLKQALDKTVIVDSQSAKPKPFTGSKGVSSVLGK